MKKTIGSNFIKLLHLKISSLLILLSLERYDELSFTNYFKVLVENKWQNSTDIEYQCNSLLLNDENIEGFHNVYNF